MMHRVMHVSVRVMSTLCLCVQGRDGWDIGKGLAHAQATAKAAGDEAGIKAAAAVKKRFEKVGRAPVLS